MSKILTATLVIIGLIAGIRGVSSTTADTPEGRTYRSTYAVQIARDDIPATETPVATATSTASLTATATPSPSPAAAPTSTPVPNHRDKCNPSYPDICVDKYATDLDCNDISARNFKVEHPDVNRFDGDGDGIGCETSDGSGGSHRPRATVAASSGGGRIGAVCRDGWRSTATGSGACSHHGGVAYWLYR